MPFKGIDWSERFPEALELGKQGKSLQQIGDHFGVSRQHISNIFKKRGVDPQEVGVKLRTKRSRETEAARYWHKWGDKEQSLYSEKRQKYRAKKANAKRAGIEFSIVFSDVEWPTHCPILGIELQYYSEGRTDASVSIDRINPAKGYVPGNVLVISWRANRLKNDGTPDEHQKIADFYKKFLT